MPKYTRLFITRTILFAIVLFAGVYQYRKYRIAPDLPAEVFAVESLQGEPVAFRPGQNGALIVKFFATWCIDCRRELPGLKAKAELFKRYKVRLILLSDEAIDDLSFFADREMLPFEIYRLPKKFKEYGIYTLPTTYIYRKNGEIASQYTNTKEITEDLVRELTK
ncbi:MAG: TlpA family protein disulfide reductase [Bacteroidia bacterium]|jgi:thiol-disulfide isomerase/thioredoxin